jgi:Holliday junction resolvase-like predicted endonuclease
MGSSPWFWRTAAGAEADLVIARGKELVVIEIKAGTKG